MVGGEAEEIAQSRLPRLEGVDGRRTSSSELLASNHLSSGQRVFLCLQGNEGVIWAEALQSQQILSRILWIAEKIVGLLLGVLESQQEVVAILIPPMLDLDFSSLLIKWLLK